MESSLVKLQRLVDKQEKQILDLKERLQIEKDKNKSNEIMLDYYKENIEKMVAKAVERQIAPILEENQRLKAENEHLKLILNNNSNNSGIPTSKTVIEKEKKSS